MKSSLNVTGCNVPTCLHVFSPYTLRPKSNTSLLYVVCEKEYQYEKSNVKFPDVLLLPARFGNAHSLDTAVS